MGELEWKETRGEGQVPQVGYRGREVHLHPPGWKSQERKKILKTSSAVVGPAAYDKIIPNNSGLKKFLSLSNK